MKTTSLFLTVVLVGITNAVDYKDIEERYSCDTFTPDPNLSVQSSKWLRSVKVWYTPMANGVEAQENAGDLIGEEALARATRTYIMEETCPYFKLNGSEIINYGFGNKKVIYESFPDPIRPGISYWAVRDDKGHKKFHATSIVTKTDNKNYFFGVTLWSNGMKGFNVNSPVASLTPEIKKEIIAHATELGFDPKNFVDISYDNCPPPPKELVE